MRKWNIKFLFIKQLLTVQMAALVPPTHTLVPSMSDVLTGRKRAQVFKYSKGGWAELGTSECVLLLNSVSDQDPCSSKFQQAVHEEFPTI